MIWLVRASDIPSIPSDNKAVYNLGAGRRGRQWKQPSQEKENKCLGAKQVDHLNSDAGTEGRFQGACRCLFCVPRALLLPSGVRWPTVPRARGGHGTARLRPRFGRFPPRGLNCRVRPTPQPCWASQSPQPWTPPGPPVLVQHGKKKSWSFLATWGNGQVGRW